MAALRGASFSARRFTCLQAPRTAVFVARFRSGRVNLLEKSEPRKENYAYVPGGPITRGTPNDAVPYPPPSKSQGSHHWAFERLVSISLIPLTVSTFALSSSPNAVLDGLLAVTLIIHSHIGFDSIITDYVHPRKFPVIGRVANWGLRVATVGALVGIYQFNTEDIGLTALIQHMWTA